MLSEVSESLHVVVLTMRSDGFVDGAFDNHTWLYPTNSSFKAFRYFDALSTIRRQVLLHGTLQADLILSDDAVMAGWLGLQVASKYGRVWMVNLHDFYWDYKQSLSRVLFNYTAVPLQDLFKNAYRMLAFSERIAIYAEGAAKTEEEKAKITLFPALYAAPLPSTSTDVKVRYPEFNFVVLCYFPPASDTWSLMLESQKLLRQQYRKAGLVVLTNKKPSRSLLAQVRGLGIEDSVRFEVVDNESQPPTNANVYLYLGGGEDEDSMFLRAVAMGQTPIIAADSVITQKILSDNVNGLVLKALEPKVIADTIRKLNETPGMRESFRVNANLLLQQKVTPPREEMLAILREFLTFEYAPADVQDKEKYLFEHLTKKHSFFERVHIRLNAIKDYYTKLK